jgi:predicted Na+-dependent transporter
MPTTMNSGLVFIQNVEGNVAFGLACVIIGQLVSCITIPFFVKMYFENVIQEDELVINIE